jgi:2-oxoglutarate dehydrogenase E1 component
VLHDQASGDVHIPLQHVAERQPRFQVIDSVLSEEAVLGFEYGYSQTDPGVLVIWEGQFGDFANGAQVIIDQFISSGRTKWGDECRLTMLLPHGYEGSGPEHSSARIERYLKLAAEDNITLCQPSTARQCFHLLRRQALSEQRRPLVVFTPKAGLRLKAANSALLELSGGEYEEVLDDPDCADWREDIDTAIVVSGKLAHDLRGHSRRMEAAHAAIIRLEQLYPFPLQQLERVLRSYSGLKRVIWAQEEPANMGAWRALRHRFEQASRGLELRYAGRSWRASPSEGYLPDHRRAQEQLILEALGLE